MKILVLSDLWPPFPGGAERLIFNLSRHLFQRGHDMQVLTGYSPALQLDGPPLAIRTISRSGYSKWGAKEITTFINSYEPNVILCHHFYATTYTNELIVSGVPLIHVVLNTERIPEAALGIYTTEWVKNLYPRPETDLVINPPALEDVVARTHGNAIGFIKPFERKGAYLFYQIAASMPDREFIVLRGEWPKIEIIQKIPNVQFMEKVFDIRDFYKRCRLILFPSTSEDAGTVAQEATMNALPCISSNVGGLPETNGGGILLDPHDLEGWISAIRSLDNKSIYDTVVARQQTYLKNINQIGKLDEFAERVEQLVL